MIILLVWLICCIVNTILWIMHATITELKINKVATWNDIFLRMSNQFNDVPKGPLLLMIGYFLSPLGIPMILVWIMFDMIKDKRVIPCKIKEKNK